MKKFVLFAVVGLLGFASCKSATCPAYSQNTAEKVDQKVMVKANTPSQASAQVNG